MNEREEYGALAVCVVDDDHASRMVASRWLEQSGFRVVQAEDGATALRLIEEQANGIAVVLLDVMMPRLDGFEVLLRLRNNPATAQIPVVLLTAHANGEEDLLRGIEGGADEHLAKPFKGKILVAKVRALYRRRVAQVGLAERLRQAEALAFSDPLTGLGNRRAFDTQLLVESSYSERHRHAFALLLLDLDRFKRVNDDFGHLEGDRVLRHVADSVLKILRRSDQAFRIGGEEFAVLLRGADRESSLRAAARVREGIRAVEFTFDTGVKRRITTSIGVAFSDENNGFRVARMFARADAALYRAKEQGRDRVEEEFENASLGPRQLGT